MDNPSLVCWCACCKHAISCRFGQGHGGLPLPYENQVLATVVVIVHSDDRATGFVFVAGSVESDGEIDWGTRATAYGICSEIDK